MNTLAERLKHYRREAGLTQQAIAAAVGIKQPSYHALESGKVDRSAYIAQIAKLLNVDPYWLVTGEGDAKVASSSELDALKTELADLQNAVEADGVFGAQNVPVISWVAAGSWSETTASTFDDASEWLARPAGLSKKAFALIVRGESMLPEFQPDDYIYVEPKTQVSSLKDGDLVVVQKIDDPQATATFKQIFIGKKGEDVYLKPLNPDWHEQKMLKLTDQWQLVGKVVGKYVKY